MALTSLQPLINLKLHKSHSPSSLHQSKKLQPTLPTCSFTTLHNPSRFTGQGGARNLRYVRSSEKGRTYFEELVSLDDHKLRFPMLGKESFVSSGRLRQKLRASSGEGAKSEASYDEVFTWASVIVPFLFPALGGLLFGYDIGATSGATISLQSPELSGTAWFSLSAVQLGLVSKEKMVDSGRQKGVDEQTSMDEEVQLLVQMTETLTGLARVLESLLQRETPTVMPREEKRKAEFEASPSQRGEQPLPAPYCTYCKWQGHVLLSFWKKAGQCMGCGSTQNWVKDCPIWLSRVSRATQSSTVNRTTVRQEPDVVTP